MDFDYRNGELYAEDVALQELAQQFGTPAYIYSARTLRSQFRRFTAAFAGSDCLICYAMKALSNLSILRLFASMGAGFDIVSGGELMRCLRAGATPDKIVFSGVGKTDEEIAAALKAGILMINVESQPELARIARVARRLQRKAPVSLRVNPDLDPGTHPHISTGHRTSKFGVPLSQVIEYYAQARNFTELELVGLSTHIGSQITDTAPFAEAGQKLARVVHALREGGIALRYLDIGGGLGIPYQEQPPAPEHYASAITAPLANLGLKLIAEPGRFIVGEAGMLLVRVLYIKETDVKRFIVVDGAMNDLIRPVLYEAYHPIWPVKRVPDRRFVMADVVGPVCESGDFFAQARELPDFEEGDLLAVMDAGAYGFVMSSNYNSRPRAPEILVDGGTAHLIRERETFEDLVAREKLVALKDG